ncbi:MAG: type II toxin-antitoxin system VapB family antitoxin [Gemmatimonadales bacterium]
MSLILDDPQTEAIARELARAAGVSVDDAVRRSVEAAATRAGLRSPRSVEEELTELRRWAGQHIRRAPGDHVSLNEILGYDNHGSW